MDIIDSSSQVRTVISQCALVLSHAGIGSEATAEEDRQSIAEYEAKYLLAQACDISVSRVTTACVLDETLSQIARPEQVERFTEWITRRESREPLQYIVGHTQFRFLDLQVGPGVFIPRPETELLVDDVLDYAHNREKLTVVDLCAGSGALGLAIASEIPTSEVYAVEISDTAYRCALFNAKKNNVTNYHLLRGDATDAQIIDSLPQLVDVVVSNPPYIPQKDIPEQIEARDYDPQLALYGGSEDGMRIPALVIKQAYEMLKPGGLFVMEHDWKQGSATRQTAQESGFSSISTQRDFAHKDRYLRAIK